MKETKEILKVEGGEYRFLTDYAKVDGVDTYTLKVEFTSDRINFRYMHYSIHDFKACCDRAHKEVKEFIECNPHIAEISTGEYIINLGKKQYPYSTCLSLKK